MIDKLSILNDNLTDDLKSCLDENNTLKERYVRRMIISLIKIHKVTSDIIIYSCICIYRCNSLTNELRIVSSKATSWESQSLEASAALAKCQAQLVESHILNESLTRQVKESKAHSWWSYMWHELKRHQREGQGHGPETDQAKTDSSSSDKAIIEKQVIEIASLRQVIFYLSFGAVYSKHNICILSLYYSYIYIYYPSLSLAPD